MELVFQT